MKIIPKIGKEEWNLFLEKNNGSFLQSWEWGESQEFQGKKIWRFCIGRENILAIVQILKEPFISNTKNFLYIPYGPCFKENISIKARFRIINFIQKEMKKISKEERSVMLKIEPINFWPKDIDARKSFKRIQPRRTSIINLKKSEEDILKSFHPKTRYNTRLALKKGIKVIKVSRFDGNIKSYLKYFYDIIQKTSKRDKFYIFERSHYKKILDTLKSELFFAKYKDNFIASNLLVYFGKRTTYLHGGSNYKFRKLMAPYLLHWEQMKESKKMGMEEYDFWGIDEERWPGLTRFKRGFRGIEIDYPAGKDFIFSKFWYGVYKLIKRF